VEHFVRVTGDRSILDEPCDFIEGQSLVPGQHDAFFRPSASDQSATVYDHCTRALDRSLAFGSHGLPLFGTGDWNDGMNRVGELGRGESVWAGWLLFSTLNAFAQIAKARGDDPHVVAWQAAARTLQVALEENAWDGKWYRRGYYDDGSLLGSAQNDECQIDAIAQSWSVISAAARPDRAALAMNESYSRLVNKDQGLALLFAPPFESGRQEPGYIKAYPAGIRENGGQYTHGAIWSIFAHAGLRQPARAMEIFDMLNPINHARDEASALNYRVEPYVIAADVYAKPPHEGRGGWTWYTGSAGWMYRAGLEAILGISQEGHALRVKPCVPQEWDHYEVAFRFGNTVYEIRLSRGVELKLGDAAAIHSPSPGEFVIGLVDSGGVIAVDLPLG
jgi:cyclic beta-1,2-glucan synthetase